MKQTKLLYIILFLVIVAIFSCIMPYPIFSNYTNITEKDAYLINNYNETELSSLHGNNPKVLDLDWQTHIDSLFEYNTPYEVFDIKTEQSFFIIRTGGENHADVEPVTTDDLQNMYEIFGENWNWKRRPVLLKYNENTYIPASLCGYPHGYSQENTSTGHFCLHFKNSKTHGTKQIDTEHQKNVSYAFSHSKKFLKQVL